MTAIGIDLGTTYSCAAVWQNGKVEVIQNNQGNRITPSFVAFTETERLIGDAAKNQVALNPENTIFDVKRFIGRKFDDEKLQEDVKFWPFKVLNQNGSPKLEVLFKGEKKIFSPEEISSMVLSKIKVMCETYLNTTIQNAVITIPAYFNDSQRQATIDAGTIAGLNVLRIISEPTAAAIAYGLEKDLKGERKVLIYDLGGGTFDVSILAIMEGSTFQVLSTSGDTHLGGEDFDNRIVSHFVEEIRRKHNISVLKNNRAMSRLRKEAEQAKKTLTVSTEARLEIDSLHEGIDFSSRISRARFDEICSDLFGNTLTVVERALKDANLDQSQIDDVVLVGGSSRIPKIQLLLQNFFKGKTLITGINADEAVAHGAALLAAKLSELSAEENAHLPELFVMDVVPLSMGMETSGGKMATVIKRNTQIPCKETKIFTTAKNNESKLNFSVFQGEHTQAAKNILLGKFQLTEIPPAPKGVPQIFVTFDVDADGILQVTAVEMSSGVSVNIAIKNDRGQLSRIEIDRMVAEAEKQNAEDAAEKNRAAVRNQLEDVIFDTKSAVNGNNMEESKKADILSHCDETIKWLDENQKANQEMLEKMLEDFKKLGVSSS